MRMSWGPQRSLLDEGLDQGVLYSGASAIPWNGLVNLAEEDSTDVITDHYFNGVRSVIVQNLGEFSAQIECFTYPEVLDDGGVYDFSYRVPYHGGYKIHLVYDAIFRSSDRSWSTMTNAFSATNFNWDLHATPVPVAGANPVSHLVLDTLEYPEVTETLENIIYGTSTTNPRLPSPQEVIDICETAAILKVRYNGDGTWTATGPSEMVQPKPDGTFVLSAPTAFPISNERFIVDSF